MSLLDLGRFSSFLILYTVARIPWTEDQSVARPLPTQTEYMHTDIHALSGIRTHDPSDRASEDSSCLRPVATTIGFCFVVYFESRPWVLFVVKILRNIINATAVT
jgi:hypothetical protein